MNRSLHARLRRLEQKAGLYADPLSLLTDEELQAAIEAVDASITAEVGMDVADYAEKLREQSQTGALSHDGLDAEVIRQFVTSIIGQREIATR